MPTCFKGELELGGGIGAGKMSSGNRHEATRSRRAYSGVSYGRERLSLQDGGMAKRAWISYLERE
jgi:hypothetical protein